MLPKMKKVETWVWRRAQETLAKTNIICTAKVSRPGLAVMQKIRSKNRHEILIQMMWEGHDDVRAISS